MIFRKSILAAVAAAAMTLPAAAQQSEVLFQHKHWRVELVAWDDGVLGCQATVGTEDESFSLWTFQDSTVQMQFYSKAWDFGEGDSADLQVQIDRKPQWNLTEAELYRNSVLFTLPDSDAGVEFIVEVAKGNRLFLRTKDGGAVQDYSLSGSRASIDALIECGNVITQEQKPSNPFN
jgi:predicted nuclease of predicted toxin-antitoxin system